MDRAWFLSAALVAIGGCKSTAPEREPTPTTASTTTRATAQSSAIASEAPAPVASAPPVATSAVPSNTDAVVQIDGKPMPSEHAFVKRLPDGKLQLYVGKGGSCAELLVNLFNDGVAPHILVDLPSRLAADGTETYGVAGIYVGPPTDADPGGTASVRGNLKAGSKVEIDLAFTGKGGRDEKLVVKGKVVAESCGDQDTSKGVLPKAVHKSTAMMTIAKKKIAIRAALVRGENIELSDFPRDCTAAWFLGARARREGTKWLLDGTRFASEVEGAPTSLTVKKGATGTSPDGPTVQLTLSGSDKIGDYPVAFSGTVEAIDCK